MRDDFYKRPQVKTADSYYTIDGQARFQMTEDSTRVLRNAYGLLALSMIPTAIGALLGVQIDWTFAMTSPILTMLGYFAITYGLIFAIQKNATSAIGVLLMLALTFVMGFALGPILKVALSLSNGGTLVAYAAGTTALIFFGLAGYVTATGKDFSRMGQFLMIGMIIVLVAAVANIFFQMPAFSLAVSSGIVLLMSMFILFDVSRIVRGGEDNYIRAALSLYLDVYNLFVALLRIMMILMGGSRE